MNDNNESFIHILSDDSHSSFRIHMIPVRTKYDPDFCPGIAINYFLLTFRYKTISLHFEPTSLVIMTSTNVLIHIVHDAICSSQKCSSTHCHCVEVFLQKICYEGWQRVGLSFLTIVVWGRRSEMKQVCEFTSSAEDSLHLENHNN